MLSNDFHNALSLVRYFRIKDWRIDGKGNRECNGGETDKGKKDTPKDCADACRGISGMFAFGPSPDPRIGICTKNCKCKCLHNTKPVCSRNYVRDYGYLLYSIYGKGRELLCQYFKTNGREPSYFLEPCQNNFRLQFVD